MLQIASSELIHLLTTYGYWAILVGVAIESLGIPFPGESILLAAAVYDGTHHTLSIVGIIMAATCGAVLGDTIGFWIGKGGGYRLLRRYGHIVHVNEGHIKLGQYLFLRHGGKVVFFGRFVAILRTWAAFLAGVNRMHWPRFFLFNAAGGLIWATIIGLGGYLFGSRMEHFHGILRIVITSAAIIVILLSCLFIHRHYQRLQQEAEQALPGPLNGQAMTRQENSSVPPLTASQRPKEKNRHFSQ